MTYIDLLLRQRFLFVLLFALFLLLFSPLLLSLFLLNYFLVLAIACFPYWQSEGELAGVGSSTYKIAKALISIRDPHKHIHTDSALKIWSLLFSADTNFTLLCSLFVHDKKKGNSFSIAFFPSLSLSTLICLLFQNLVACAHNVCINFRNFYLFWFDSMRPV